MDQITEHIWILMARKLSGEGTPGELEQLETLLNENPHENYSLEVMQDIWNNKTAPDSQYSENKYKELLIRMQRLGIHDNKFPDDTQLTHHAPAPKANWVKWSLFFAPILIILVTTLMYTNRNGLSAKPGELPSNSNNEITTKYGSKSNLKLPDGTMVYLNAGSKLIYDKNFGISSRIVYLSGEAYFDVVKNIAKPFIIHTRNMDIKVTGTAFNVKCYPDEKQTETSLIRGSVEITLKDRTEKIILKPNEKLIIHDDLKPAKANMVSAKDPEQPLLTLSHLTPMQKDNSVAETSWLENKLVFSSETFEEIATKMERWFAVNIRFANEKLKTIKFTGVFEKETIDQALNALQLTATFSYKINRDSIVIDK